MVVASLAIMFFALLPPVLFYVTHEAQVSVRLASAGYGLYVAQVMIRRVRAFRRARTPLRTYLWTLVVGPTVVLVLMVLNVALWGTAGVHAFGPQQLAGGGFRASREPTRLSIATFRMESHARPVASPRHAITSCFTSGPRRDVWRLLADGHDKEPRSCDGQAESNDHVRSDEGEPGTVARDDADGTAKSHDH